MNSQTWRFVLTGLVLVALAMVPIGDAAAQCATCPAPAVGYQPVGYQAVGYRAVTAYQPVVAQPTVAYRPYTGWYPGKWLDQWRLRRAGVATKASVYGASVYGAPVYSAAYSPYTASYAPTTAAYASTYTAAYRPYVSAYAPLSAPATAACGSCAPAIKYQAGYYPRYQASYYPITYSVARPVLMRPVVAASPCNTCSFTPTCACDACSSGCGTTASDGCSTGVSQAGFTEPACSNCVGGAAPINVVPEAAPNNNIGPQTPQPSLPPSSTQRTGLGSAQAGPPFQSNRPVQADGNESGKSTDGSEADLLQNSDPGPAANEEDSSTFFNAPHLLIPRDRTARNTNSRKPTVDVWNAVYRKSTTGRKLSPAGSRGVQRPVKRRPATQPLTQAEIDADGWSAVRRNR